MKTKRYEFEFEKVQPGDVIVSATRNTVIVDRPVKDTYEEGTALLVKDSAHDPLVLFKMSASAMREIQARPDHEWLALYDDGSMGPVEFEDYVDEIEAGKVARSSIFDEGPKPPLGQPVLTREHFLDTLKRTAQDNNLDLDLREGALNTLLVFAADRLGLR